MKNSIYSFLLLVLFLEVSGFAQEEKLDKFPEPIGGIEIIKNVTELVVRDVSNQLNINAKY